MALIAGKLPAAEAAKPAAAAIASGSGCRRRISIISRSSKDRSNSSSSGSSSSITTTRSSNNSHPSSIIALPTSRRASTLTSSTRRHRTAFPHHDQHLHQHQQYTQQQTRHQSTIQERDNGPRTALFFPGQGVQRVGMTADWLEAFPRTAKPILEEIDNTMHFSLSRIIAEGPNSKLTATENAQPAIMATSILILKILEQEFGFKVEERVDVTLGHSLGEFAALVAAGYLREADALRMVRRRGEAMARCSREVGEEVGMVALVCEADHLAAMIDGIHGFLGAGASEGSKADSASDTDLPPVQQVLIANINAKNQIVLSGSIARINELLNHLRQFGGHDPRAVRLKSDSPFHSPLMAPAAELMQKLLDKPSVAAPGQDVVVWPGRVPCVSNVSAQYFTSKEQLKDLLARQCCETVLWHDSIVFLHQQEKVRRWVGIGPGKVGRNLVGKEVGMKGAVKGGGVWGISDPREVENIIRDLDRTEDAEGED